MEETARTNLQPSAAGTSRRRRLIPLRARMLACDAARDFSIAKRREKAVSRQRRDLTGPSPLDAGGAALGKRPHLIQRGHGRVAGECRNQRAVRPPELDGVFMRFAAHQAVEHSGGEAIAAADTIVDVELAHRRTDTPSRRSTRRRPRCDDWSSAPREASSPRP